MGVVVVGREGLTVLVAVAVAVGGVGGVVENGQ